MADDDRSWHLDKKVPIALIVTILIQTFAFGVWVENHNQRIGWLEDQNSRTVIEFAKLEAARESTNLTLNTVQGDIKSILELARRNDTRNVVKSRSDLDHP